MVRATRKATGFGRICGLAWRAAPTTAAILIGRPATSQTVLPPPSYANSVHVLFDAPGLAGPDATFASSADAILSLPHGPYAKLGAYTYSMIDMPWTQDPAAPVLTAPSAALLTSILDRLQSRGLEFHLALLGGMSRGTWVYDEAFREDRRNAQWYGDGALLKISPDLPTWSETYATPSRYARRLRRHMEAKVRETARLLVRLRKEFPETFLSASGDGEAELNLGGLDSGKPYSEQAIADYSPFAVLEFRDWIQHEGLYAPGQPYAGQGFDGGGARFQGDAGLADFNVAYGTSFASWSLRYFNWNLSDPVDGDPGALPSTTYDATGWSPLPASGAGFVDGGFDAPREWDLPSPAFYGLWLRFREALVKHYVSDFADWIVTTPDAEGTTFEAERFFTHQIPAEYLGGTWPGCAEPDRRLLTSASTLDTAFPRSGRMGLTVFDIFDGTGTIATSEYLVPEIRRRGVPSWGLMEYGPSWPAGGNDPDIAGITGRIQTAVDAGAHVINFHTWPHFFSDFYTSSRGAFTAFLATAQALPRDRSTTSYILPRVRGLRGDRIDGRADIRWRSEVFFGNSLYFWSDWPGLDHFDVWRGRTPDFVPPGGQLVGTTRATSFVDTKPDPAMPFYRVVPLPAAGPPGELSTPWAQGFYPVTPCRAVDTRETAGGSAAAPALAADSERVFTLAGKCGIPENATAVSANLTVADAADSGFLQIVPANAAFTSATAIHFKPIRARANNAFLYLATDDTGGVKVRNNSGGSADLVVDVTGYFE